MLLHSRIIGEGNNIIVILHGLFGSGDNWKTYANKLESEGFCIHLIDQRNHGRSFHSNEFNYNLLVKDLKHYLDHNKIHNCILPLYQWGPIPMLFDKKLVLLSFFDFDKMYFPDYTLL